MSSRTDYFGREMVKRLPPVKCWTCGRVVAGERSKDGQCLGCAKGKVPSRPVKLVGEHIRRGSLL